MIAQNETKHTHQFIGKPELRRITKVQRNYKGTAGDKAFILRRCSCGKGKPIEYGSYKDMNLKLKELLK